VADTNKIAARKNLSLPTRGKLDGVDEYKCSHNLLGTFHRAISAHGIIKNQVIFFPLNSFV
jgi:hypothetical protein